MDGKTYERVGPGQNDEAIVLLPVLFHQFGDIVPFWPVSAARSEDMDAVESLARSDTIRFDPTTHHSASSRYCPYGDRDP